jgi:hypothetical protein
MRLSWGHFKDGTYEAAAREGDYRIKPRGNEWCLEKPYPSPGRIGGFSTPDEAMAWGDDLHSAAGGPRVHTPAPSWPTVDEFSKTMDMRPNALRSWIAAHDSGSTSPRRRLDPTTQQRIRTFYKTHTNR